MAGRGFSTRFIRKGALIDESRVVLQRWNSTLSVQSALDSALADNPVAAKSSGWLDEIKVSLSGRFTKLPAQEMSSIVSLAKSGCDRETWTACLHWHYARIDSLYYAFVTEWLFTHFNAGTYRLRSEDVQPFVAAHVKKVRGANRPLSEYGIVRAARDLLRMASDFGLLRGTLHREFLTYVLPEESFMYLLHAMADIEPNARRIVDAEVWHMYLMDSSDVERELLRLHQFKKVQYETAGSLAQLKLPCGSSIDYARELCS